MTITFYRLPVGADARALLEGLPGGACHCPHWGYLIAGKLRIHTASGPVDVEAGPAFHVEPGARTRGASQYSNVRGVAYPTVARGLGVPPGKVTFGL